MVWILPKIHFLGWRHNLACRSPSFAWNSLEGQLPFPPSLGELVDRPKRKERSFQRSSQSSSPPRRMKLSGTDSSARCLPGSRNGRWLVEKSWGRFFKTVLLRLAPGFLSFRPAQGGNDRDVGFMPDQLPARRPAKNS